MRNIFFIDVSKRQNKNQQNERKEIVWNDTFIEDSEIDCLI